MNRTSYWAAPLRDKPLRTLREPLGRKDFCGADQVLFERSAAVAAGLRSSLLRRPGTHGQPAYFRQLLARGPIARLHRKSARYRTVVGGQHVAIDILGYVAIRHALPDAGRHRAFRKGAMLGHHVANVAHARRAMRARQRDHAAERVIAAGELFRGRLEQPRESRPGIDRRVIEDGEEPLAGPLQIGARGLAIERFLAAER